jgi:1-phosphofructokinase
MAAKPKVAIFSPNPMVSIAIERFSADGGDDIHVHPAGQGVWVARMAAELGAEVVLCGFIGGEVGTVLRPLLEQMPVELRLVETTEASARSSLFKIFPAELRGSDSTNSSWVGLL